ncbi:MAG: thioredoxin family protein [Sulfuriflexus sp.]|nr:thioredoxin family protein [Sulfuriflexus sp.]
MTNLNGDQVIPVHATLLVAPACPHCPQIKKVLTELLAQGQLASLELVDISIDLERAEKLAVRTVPWCQLNSLELQGAHSRDEIVHWVEQAARQDGRQQLFDSLLEVGQLAQVESMLRRHPAGMSDLLILFADQERQINVRIGASVVLESLQGSGLLEQVVDEIGSYTQHKNISTRIDACYVLSLIQHPTAQVFLTEALGDSNAEVREVAQESLNELREAAD